MAASTEALQREVQELREENAALLEALRLAQRGDVDLRGHLSKWNPDATTLGIFSQDWELRYFVLSGTLLKYFSSERDVGIESARGVLDLQDCYVDVELPVKSSGPFIFQIRDPQDELLLRLSADNLKIAKTWVRTLAAAGLAVQGFEKFRTSSVYQGLNSGPMLEVSSEAVAGSTESSAIGTARVPSTTSAPVGWGSRLGRALHSLTSWKVNRTDSDLSIVRLASAAARTAAVGRPATADAATGIQPEASAAVPSAFQQQQQQLLEDDGENSGDLRDIEHLKRMSTVTRSSMLATPQLTRAASTKRWGKTDLGDELPSPKQSSDGQAEASDGSDSESDTDQDEHQQQLSSRLSMAAAASATTGISPNRFMPRGDSSTLGPTQDAAGVPTGVPAASAFTEAPAAASELAAISATAAAASPSPARVAGRHKQRTPMDGASPVHIAVKDSVLTWVDDLSVSRHEGLLNLGLVVLIATNIRMIMSNIFTYGLRLRISKAGMANLAHAVASSRDDWITLAAVPGCLLFGFAALLIELLGLALLRHEQKLLSGLIKKDTPPAEVRKQAAAAAVWHEWLLFVLNMANVGGSLVLPCWLVLSNQAHLIAAFYLTMQSIITSMKLTTYAHCNTTLRHRTRRQSYRAALGRPSRSTSGAVTPFEAVPLVTQSAATAAGAADLQTPFATQGAGAATTQGYNPDIATYFTNTALGSKNGQTPAQKDVTYPNNLNPMDLLYFLFAPTLTYQLNFPRIKKRRRRLLVKWCVMLIATTLLMGFMQVQFLLPLMQSSLAPLRELNMLRFTERLLRLSIPSLAHWVAMFFLVFHLFLNITGELLLFGDRVFYKEWWNAATLADYWKLWNIPFHKWMLRTVFFPLTRRGVSKFWSLMIVFFVSAVMHELAVGVPLRMLKGWAFLGMFLQVPLISLTEAVRKRLKSDSWGNIIFWLSFCVLGQPMCLILYYHDWLLGNVGMQGIAQAAAEGAGAVANAAADLLNGTCASAVSAVGS